MQKFRLLSCFLSHHIGRNRLWPFHREHTLPPWSSSTVCTAAPATPVACLTSLLQEGTASLEQELVPIFSELPSNFCCLTACATSSLLPLSCVVYYIFSLVLIFCCFISLFSYLFFSPDPVQFSYYSYFCFLSLSISLSYFTAFCPKSWDRSLFFCSALLCSILQRRKHSVQMNSPSAANLPLHKHHSHVQAAKTSFAPVQTSFKTCKLNSKALKYIKFRGWA